MTRMTKTLTAKTLIGALALGSALVFTGAANAHPWGGGFGGGYGQSYGGGYGTGGGYGGGYYRDPREQDAINRQLVDSTCSGRRGYMLENRLRSEVNHGQIDSWTASRIQSSINQLQNQERRECSEHDFEAARDIGKDYIRVRAWIDQESGGYRNGNGSGGYYRR